MQIRQGTEGSKAETKSANKFTPIEMLVHDAMTKHPVKYYKFIQTKKLWPSSSKFLGNKSGLGLFDRLIKF